MPAVHDVIKLAKQLDSKFVVDYDKEMNVYKVSIVDVWYREKDTYLKLAIFGHGTTIEDASLDYLRKCRGDKLVHIITDKEIAT